MKKLILMTVVFCAVLSAAHAQWTVGGRLGPMFGFHTSGAGMNSLAGTGIGISEKSKMNFVIAAYGSYAFTSKLSLQPELNVMINQGQKLSSVFGSGDVVYTSLDIPVLVKFTIWEPAVAGKPLSLGLHAGPLLSIPLGGIKTKISGYSSEIDTDGITFGITTGTYAAYPLGPGRIVADLRFLFDFNAVKAKSSGVSVDYFTRRGLIFTAGYEISF
ncbi:MAG: outer membrane beta-barrel protein [Treponema sp.]|jgi:hypothetical protein|nr:outer membrane beta-barrel protein [Treponema sp.]